jgi:hypothetical protein
MKVLVAGWFSYSYGHATAGDLLVRDVICDWLREANIPFDSAYDTPFDGGVHRLAIKPEDYSHVVFVCGPFGRDAGEPEFLAQFPHANLIGVNLTMRLPLAEWRPFDTLLERDSTERVRPDVAFLSDRPLVPVVGVCLVEDYPQGLTGIANAAIEKLLKSRDVVAVPIDTRLDTNSTGLRTPAQVESLLARMDAVVTTRLHGCVLSLKHGVPVVAIDPSVGGGKILKQMSGLQWPFVFTADRMCENELSRALDYCLTGEARVEARNCTRRANRLLTSLRDEFLTAFQHGNGPSKPRVFEVTDSPGKHHGPSAENQPLTASTEVITPPPRSFTRRLVDTGKRAVKAVARKTLPHAVRHLLRGFRPVPRQQTAR